MSMQWAGAGRRAEEAGHALHAALLVAIEPMHTTVDERVADGRSLLGKAHRHLRAHKMPGGRRKALHEKRQVEPLGESERFFFEPGDGGVGRLHQNALAGVCSVMQEGLPVPIERRRKPSAARMAEARFPPSE